MDIQIKKDERIEFRVSSEDKELFQKAQKLLKEKTFSSFVTRIVREKSKEIIEENDKVLATERDREIFFNAVLGDLEPNDNLLSAAKKYNQLKK